MDVDILLWGGTHRFEAFEMEGRFFVNPGSATGAFSTGYWPEGEEPTPSFCLMDVSLGYYESPGSPVCMCMLTSKTGPRRCARAVCLPAQDRCQWKRDGRRREGVVPQEWPGCFMISVFFSPCIFYLYIPQRVCAIMTFLFFSFLFFCSHSYIWPLYFTVNVPILPVGIFA